VLSRFTLGPAAAVTVVVKCGYWVVLVLLAFFGFCLVRLAREAAFDWRMWKTHRAAMLTIAATAAVLFAHERYGFKILADEYLLLGTSENLHYERQAAYPLRATDVQGPFQITESHIDKRPILFPVLVSLAHDLTGYRPENAFYVNTLLGLVFLALLWAIGEKVGRSAWAGAVLVLLFGGLPLFAQQLKGGGFDLLNLVVLATVLLLGIRYAERRDASSLSAYCGAVLLLAYARYESILVLVPAAALVVTVWYLDDRVLLPWPVVVSPLALIVPLLHNRVFTVVSSAWEMSSRHADVPFGLKYLKENLRHALAFFFDPTGYQPNSPFFAGLGLVAVVFFALWIVRTLTRARTSTGVDVATARIGTGLFGIFGLLMVYFWGQFDDPIIHRLSLPVHLLMAVAVAAVGAQLWRSVRPWQALSAAALIALVVYSLPSMVRRAYAVSYSPAAEMEWREDFLRRFPEKDYLFIDNDSVFWIAHRIPATPNVQAKAREEGLIYHLRNDSFSGMYVMQHFRIDPTTGARTMVADDDVGPDFELEPVWEKRIQTLFIGRISRVVAIHQGGAVAARAAPIVQPPKAGPLPGSTDAWDAARQAYVDKWLKQLP
jgi:hypothetical protein